MACKVLKKIDLINSYLENTETLPEKTLNLSKWKRKLQAIPSPKDGDSDIFLEEIREFIEVIISSICSKNKKHVQQFQISRAGFILLQNILEDNSRHHLINIIAKLVFDVIIEENTDCWLAKRELLRVFNKWFGTIKKIVNIKPLPGIYLLKMVDSLTVTGDYDLQLNILETIFRMYGQEINERLRDMIPESQELSQSFSEIHPDTFDEDCRRFLNVINRKSDKIFSLVCASVQLDGTSCDPPLDSIDGFWVDFNTIDKVITWHYVGPSFNDSIWDLLMLFPSEINTVLVGSKKFPESYVIQFLLKGHLVTSDVKATEVIGKVKEVTFIISRSEGAEKLINQILPKMLENLIPESVKPQASSSTEVKIYKPLDIKISKNQHRRSVSSIISTANFTLSFDASSKTYKSLSSEEESDTRNVPSIKDHNISEENNDDVLNLHSIKILASNRSFLSPDFNLTIENEENTQRLSNASPPKQESDPKVSSSKPYRMTEGGPKTISKFSKPIEQKVNSKTNHSINRQETIEEDTRDIHKNRKSLNASQTLNIRIKEKTQESDPKISSSVPNKTDKEVSKNIPVISKPREQKNDLKKQNRKELDRRPNSFLNRCEIIEEDLIDTEKNRIKEDTQESDPRISSSDQYETVNECPKNIPKISRPVKQKVYPKRRHGEELEPVINSPPNRHKTIQEDPGALQRIRKEKVLNIGSSENTHESDPRISCSDQYKTVKEYPDDISKISRPIKLNPCLKRSLRGREVLSSKPISANQQEERRAHSSSYEYETANEGTKKISKNIKDIGENKIVLKSYPELTEDKTNLHPFNIPNLNQDSYPEITEDFDSLKVNIPNYANKENINISDVPSLDDSMDFAEEIITSGKIIPNSIQNSGSKYYSQEVDEKTDVDRDNNHSGRPQILCHIVIAPATEEKNSHSKIKPTLENEEEDAEKENLHEDDACTYSKVDIPEAKENELSLEIDKQEEFLRVNSRIENSSLKIVSVKKMLKTYPPKNKIKLKNGSESKKALFKDDQNSKEQNLSQLDEKSNIAKPNLIYDFKCETVIEKTAAECKPDSKVASQEEKFTHDEAKVKEQLEEKKVVEKDMKEIKNKSGKIDYEALSTNISSVNKSVSVAKKKYPKRRIVKPKKYRSHERKRGDDSFTENEISNIQDSNQRVAEEHKTHTKVGNENINNSNSISITDSTAIENKEERESKIAKRLRSSLERESFDESSAENEISHQQLIIRVDKIDIHNINSTEYLSHDTDVKHKELDRQHEKIVQKSELLKKPVNILETQKREEAPIREKSNTSEEYLKKLKNQDNATDNKFVSKNLSEVLDSKQKESSQGEKIDEFEITEATKMLEARNVQRYSKRENKKPKRFIQSSDEESVFAENLTKNKFSKTEKNKTSKRYSLQIESSNKSLEFVYKDISNEPVIKLEKSKRKLKKVVENTKKVKMSEGESTKILETEKSQRYPKRERRKTLRYVISSDEESVFSENSPKKNSKKKFNESCGRYPLQTKSTNKNIKEISDIKHNESNSQCKEGSSETENVKMAWVERSTNNYRNIKKRNQKSKVDIDHEMSKAKKIDTENDVTENNVTDKIGGKTLLESLLESPKSVVENGVSLQQRLTGESETIENIQKLIEAQYDLPTQDYNSVDSIDGSVEHHEHDEIGKEDHTEIPIENEVQVNCVDGNEHIPDNDPISDISNNDINNENVTAETNLEKYSLENHKTIENVLSKENLNPPIRDQQLWKNQGVVSFDVESNNSSVRNIDLNQTGSSLIKPQEFNGGQVRSEVIEHESFKSNLNSSVVNKELNQTVPIPKRKRRKLYDPSAPYNFNSSAPMLEGVDDDRSNSIYSFETRDSTISTTSSRRRRNLLDLTFSAKERVDIKQIYPKNTINNDKKSKNPLDDTSKVTRGRQETKRRSVKEIMEDLEKTDHIDKEPIENVKVVENKPIISKRDPRRKSFVNQNKDSDKLVEISDIVKETVQNVKDLQAAPEKSSLLDEPKTNVTVKLIEKRNESIPISMKTTKRNITKTRRSSKSKEMRKLDPFQFKMNNSKKTTTTKELLEKEHQHKKRMEQLEKSQNVSLNSAGSNDKFKTYFDIMLKSWKTGVAAGKYLNKDNKKSKKRDNRAVKDRHDKKKLETYSSTPHKKRSRFNIGDLDISEIPKICNKANPLDINTKKSNHGEAKKEKSIRFSNVEEDTRGPEEYVTATTLGLLLNGLREKKKRDIVVQSDIPLKPWNHAHSPNIPTIEDEAALATSVLSAGDNNEIRRYYLPTFSDCLIGNPAPVWTANALFEDNIITINSSKFIGKYLVIFFYPLDFGVLPKMDPPIELFNINENYEKFRQLNAEVVSCSVDSCYTHKAFLKYHCLNNNLPAMKLKFPLLADVTHKISKDYRVYSETLGHSCRGFAIIDPKGILVAMNVAELTPPVLIEEIINKITRCQLSYV